MRSFVKATPTVALVVLLFSATLSVRPALALTASTTTGVTCLKLEDKCLAHVRARLATQKADSDGVARPHMTENECYDSYHEAVKSGIWPERLPFNFATNCTP